MASAFHCLVCDSKENTPELVVDRYTLRRCLACTAVFLTPRPDMAEAIENNLEVYDGEKTLKTFASMEGIMTRRAERQVRVIRSLQDTYTSPYPSPSRRGEKINQGVHKKLHVLDVGCSYGYALRVFREYGYEPYGIDISPVSVRFVQEHHGIPAETVSFEAFQTKKRFDVILMLDVIEHFENPRAAVKKAYELLNPGGILLVQTPNYDSLIRRVTGKQWYWLLVPWHLTLFTPASIRTLLSDASFTVGKLTTWDDMYEIGSNVLDIIGLKREGHYKRLHRRISKVIAMTGPISHLWNRFKLGGELEVYAVKRK